MNAIDEDNEKWLENKLLQAFAYHQAGNLHDAELLYREILEKHPTQSNANHNLALILFESNRVDLSLGHFNAALEATPVDPQNWISYIEALITVGQLAEAGMVMSYGVQSGLAGPALDQLQETLAKAEANHQGIIHTPVKKQKTKKVSAKQALADLAATFNQGDFVGAERLALDIIKKQPSNGVAWNILGSIYERIGEADKAFSAFKQAAALLPKDAEAQYNLANCYLDQKQLEAANDCYQKAIALQPDFFQAHYNLGSVYEAQGAHHEAIECYKRAAEINPNNAAIHFNLALLLHQVGEYHEAINFAKHGLSLQPDQVNAHMLIGACLSAQGLAESAEIAFKNALEVDPTHLSALNNLSDFYREHGRLDESERGFRKIIALDPSYLDAYNNLGLVLAGMGRHAEAEAIYKDALNIEPEHAAILSNLAITLTALNKLKEAEYFLLQSIELAPNFLNAYINLCQNYIAQGRVHEAEAISVKALGVTPSCLPAMDNLLFLMNYSDQYSIENCLESAKTYGLVATKLAQAPFLSWLASSQSVRLRIGFVSGDLRNHAVAFFLESLVRHVDQSKLDLYAYSNDPREDKVTARLKPHFTQWKSLVGLDDQKAATLIHADGIHILIDLSGHSAGNRLSVFAWRPAPVQISWLGYFATTGLAEMDYFIADEVGVPVANQSHFVEKMKYLPDTRLCFTPPDALIEVSPLPAIKNGFVTFGCFQNMAKVTDTVIRLWARVMNLVPSSKLRWQCKSFADEDVVNGVRQRFAQFGVKAECLMLTAPAARDAYLAAHADVDFILDTFPFNGGTTTCEALWMGVPTLTLAGDTLISRQGASILSAAGLTDWLVDSEDAYVSKVIALAGNLDYLSQLRKGLRLQVLNSPLFDGSRFACHMENLLFNIWADYTKQQATKDGLLEKLLPIEVERKKQISAKAKVVIVSATKLSESDFWKTSALGLSLKRHMKKDDRFLLDIAFNNATGLSALFNLAIDKAPASSVLAFIHDDVWLDEVNFVDTLLEGLTRYDIVGLAGNRRRIPHQPGWFFTNIKEGKFIQDAYQNLSGRVAHGEAGFGKVSDFGKVPADCLLLDGVFIAATKDCLDESHVRFDPQFDFHFYDLDFCRTVEKLGLKMGTWPIQITHQSGGAFGAVRWVEQCKLYFNKWEQTSTRNNGEIMIEELESRDEKLQDVIKEVLQMALEYQNSARLDEAASLYKEVLSIAPNHGLASHHLGVLEMQTLGVDKALPRFELAIQANPESEQYWVSYIDALVLSGAVDTAVDALELGQKFGLSQKTAELMAAEFVRHFESQRQNPTPKPTRQKFREHMLAHRLLGGLYGLEIGGAAHNPFGLNTLNVDYKADLTNMFKQMEFDACGESMPVDIVTESGDQIPLPDKSVDFVINSHVVEHFFDPIKAIKEWMRLAKQYVFMIVPLPNALPSDCGKPLTTLQELLDRHHGKIKPPKFDPDLHYSIWNCETFIEMCEQFIGDYGFHVSHYETVDTKVGNGFTVVLQHDSVGSMRESILAMVKSQ